MLFLRRPPPPDWSFGPHAHPMRLNWPILFIGHQALLARVPLVVATVPHATAAHVHRPLCAIAARVRRPLCTTAAHVHRDPPIVDHAHSPPILSKAGPPSSLAVDLGHQIRVLRVTNFAWSRPISDLIPQNHQAPPLHRQGAHSTMSP
jgi:hypothetical protein